MYYDFVIIDPASTEFNRGSFCYLPYILYSALKADGFNVHIEENFTLADIDTLPPADKYLCSLWSYPQIDIVLGLKRFIKDEIEFFGYYPLVIKEKLPIFYVTDEMILKGIQKYPETFSDFKYILLSDCDMHLKEYKGQVYPLFTSYGCPNGCSFCPTTANTNSKCTKFLQRVSLTVSESCQVLAIMHEKGFRNIHFTDEDFFYDFTRAYKILKYCKKLGGFNFIALGSVKNVERFVGMYGQQILKDAGIRLLEIGFETADHNIAQQMGKPTVQVYRDLISQCDIPILYLTLSFYPGETYNTIYQTGVFLEQHGFEPNELYGRIQTNGTMGGLGQFFQPYVGTRGYENILKKGMLLSDRPVRLIPSFLPNSLLDDKIKLVGTVKFEDYFWFDLYNLDDDMITSFCSNIKEGTTMREVIEDFSQYRSENIAIFLSLCARLGVITSGK